VPLSDPLSPGNAWVRALHEDDLWTGEKVGLRLAGEDVLLLKLGDGEILAYDDRCPHAGTLLSQGTLSLATATLVCATHRWEFDVRSGAGVNPANCALTKLPVKVVDGVVFVLVKAREG
jgi:toluene monooxygenase system ferredoxin subunit